MQKNHIGPHRPRSSMISHSSKYNAATSASFWGSGSQMALWCIPVCTLEEAEGGRGVNCQRRPSSLLRSCNSNSCMSMSSSPSLHGNEQLIGGGGDFKTSSYKNKTAKLALFASKLCSMEVHEHPVKSPHIGMFTWKMHYWLPHCPGCWAGHSLPLHLHHPIPPSWGHCFQHHYHQTWKQKQHPIMWWRQCSSRQRPGSWHHTIHSILIIAGEFKVNTNIVSSSTSFSSLLLSVWCSELTVSMSSWVTSISVSLRSWENDHD